MGRNIFHQPRMLQAPSNPALSTTREGAATASLGSLGQGLSTLKVKNFFLTANLNLPSFGQKPSPLVLSLHALVKRTFSPTIKWNMLHTNTPSQVKQQKSIFKFAAFLQCSSSKMAKFYFYQPCLTASKTLAPNVL